ncbi:MAG: phosphoribosylanthranilate isomerase [Cyclobacteriaceae bacterium]
MRDSKNILDVAELHPDFMGFIFYPKSKRFIGNDFKIPDALPKQIKRVGVFVNESLENILFHVKKHFLDYVQLHGDEDYDFCRSLHAKVKIIKVFSVDHSFDFENTKQFEDFSDYFLFDTKTETFGGSGISFDWSLLQKYSGNIPIFLSGGLSPDNIYGVNRIKNENLFALDLNSGVEISPGLKDKNKISDIIKY